MTRRRWILLLTVLILAVTAFIFSNSLKGSEASHEDSDVILSWIQPLVERIFGEGRLDVSYLVRKAAHMTEFCLLSVLVFCLIEVADKGARGYGFFYLLAVAVTDELIQSYTGRTSLVMDIYVDFAGAMIGFCVVFLITTIKKRKKNGD